MRVWARVLRGEAWVKAMVDNAIIELEREQSLKTAFHSVIELRVGGMGRHPLAVNAENGLRDINELIRGSSPAFVEWQCIRTPPNRRNGNECSTAAHMHDDRYCNPDERIIACRRD
jgi:hypothetical protein